MLESDLHEFHCVMGRNLRESLQDLDLFNETGSVSGVIVRIASILSMVIKSEHKWGEQRWSRYRSVCKDPGEVREHIHVYFPVKVYKKLKQLHQDLNTYSIAQLLREFLEFFIGLVERYGNNVIKELRKMYMEWEELEQSTYWSKWKFLRQLMMFCKHSPEKMPLITLYNDNSSPIWVFSP